MSDNVPKIDTTTLHNEEFKTGCPGVRREAVQSRTMPKTRPDGYSVPKWPEFLAFAKRLGVNLELPFTKLVITIEDGACPLIQQTYLGDDIDQQDATTGFDDADHRKRLQAKSE